MEKVRITIAWDDEDIENLEEEENAKIEDDDDFWNNNTFGLSIF